MVASGVFVLIPVFEPKAGALLYHDSSAAWEDQDFGGGLDYNGDASGSAYVMFSTLIDDVGAKISGKINEARREVITLEETEKLVIHQLTA